MKQYPLRPPMTQKLAARRRASEISSTVTRRATNCTCIRQSFRHVVTSSNSPSNLVPCTQGAVRPRTPAQRLHVDFPSDVRGWPMVGFIDMIHHFTRENGETCFALGSQGMEALPASFSLVQACG